MTGSKHPRPFEQVVARARLMRSFELIEQLDRCYGRHAWTGPVPEATLEAALLLTEQSLQEPDV